MQDLRRYPHAVAALSTATLALWPGVGLFQAALSGALIVVIHTLWQTGARSYARRAAPANGGLVARGIAVAAWVAVSALLASYPVLALQSFDAINVRGPELLWLLAAIPAAVGVAALIARGRATIGTIVQGLVLGLVSTAAWVPLGRFAGLDLALRFHPVATIVLAAATIVLAGVSMFIERQPLAASRWAALLFAQSLGLTAYWLAGSADSHGKLGYIANETRSTSPDGRLHVEVDERGSTALVFINDPADEERSYVTTIYGPHAGRRFEWSADKLEVRWFAPNETYDADCTAEYLFSDFWQSQARRHAFELCDDPDSPLGCRRRELSRGSACTRDRECATQRCIADVCVGSALGETCVTDASCDEGTCVGRVCRVQSGLCDSNGDCVRYCYRDPGQALGQCYAGDPGDPCAADWGECLNSTCVDGFCARK